MLSAIVVASAEVAIYICKELFGLAPTLLVVLHLSTKHYIWSCLTSICLLSAHCSIPDQHSKRCAPFFAAVCVHVSTHWSALSLSVLRSWHTVNSFKWLIKFCAYLFCYIELHALQLCTLEIIDSCPLWIQPFFKLHNANLIQTATLVSSSSTMTLAPNTWIPVASSDTFVVLSIIYLGGHCPL